MMSADPIEPQLAAHRAHLISSSPEDDAAYVALADLSKILASYPECRVIGGHMVNLLTTVFPAENRTNRAVRRAASVFGRRRNRRDWNL